jgi:hypothetical protein
MVRHSANLEAMQAMQAMQAILDTRADGASVKQGLICAAEVTLSISRAAKKQIVR